MQRPTRLKWPINPSRLTRLRPTKPTMPRPMKLTRPLYQMNSRPNVIGEIVAADEAIVIDKVVAVDVANVAVDEANDTIEANDSNDAIVANEANEADKAIVASEADDSDDEADGVLDNQLTELEKLDEANEAV